MNSRSSELCCFHFDVTRKICDDVFAFDVPKNYSRVENKFVAKEHFNNNSI